MSQPKRIAHADLEQFFLDALAAVGVPPHVAAVEAQIGAEVDLHGGHTHGVALLPSVINYIRQGVLAPNPHFETIVEYPTSRLIDAGGGVGRFSSAQGMDWALERARQYGVGACVVRNVGHWGRGHSYALRAARAGLVGLAFTNAFANFPAWGTRVPSLGNNPLAIGIPTADGEPVVLDLAMTQSSPWSLYLSPTLPVHNRPVIGIQASSIGTRFADLGHELVFVDGDAEAGLCGQRSVAVGDWWQGFGE